ncbi:MAG TPA: glycosyltransferase [Candidatus Dormibacteraeota bacterium]|nr:glycosyltransferase [Candidatus Dormibacteraeota bacterium]
MKLSVRIITYNHERFLAQALESILDQRVNFDYEIVVGEDCSTDGTRKILMDFYRRFPDRIVPLLRNHNLGGARNFCDTLASCQGQYVAMLDGDDYWTSEDKLQQQVDFLDQHPDYALCCHRAQLLDETDAGRAGVWPPLAAGSYSIKELLRENFVLPAATVYRRDSAGALPSWLGTMEHADWGLFALIANHGKVFLMDEVMAVYRLHSGAAWSARPGLDQRRESIRMLMALDRHLDFQYTDTIRRNIAEYFLDMARATLQNREAVKTGHHLLNCLRFGGWRVPGSRRMLAALAAYTLIGSRYKVFSRAKQASRG